MIDDGELTGKARQGLLTAAIAVQHDAFVLGYGNRLTDGTVGIKDYAVGGNDPNVDEAFVEAYKPLAGDDLAAQALSSRASCVLRIPIKHYLGLGRKTGSKLRELFVRVGIEHLLLVGIESNYGIAWLTLYRTTGGSNSKPPAFDVADCEAAMYSIRGALYDWQRSFLPRGDDIYGVSRFDLVQLSPSVFETALWSARGYSYKEIEANLSLDESTIRKNLQTAAEALQTGEVHDFRKALLERMLGPMPPKRTKRI